MWSVLCWKRGLCVGRDHEQSESGSTRLKGLVAPAAGRYTQTRLETRPSFERGTVVLVDSFNLQRSVPSSKLTIVSLF